MRQLLICLSLCLFGITTGLQPQTALALDNQEIIEAVYANPLRSDADKSRDGHRKPDQVLDFWGITPSDHVADLAAGGGYYTKILARYLQQGHVTAVTNAFVAQKFPNRLSEIQAIEASEPNVSRIQGRFDKLNLPENLDSVLFVNFYHDTVWMGYDRDKMNLDIFKALKPGGTYLVIDHEAHWNTGLKAVKTLHRIEGRIVIEEILKAGFHLVKSSPMHQKSEDDLNLSAVKLDERRGQTARFVYLFQKPHHPQR